MLVKRVLSAGNVLVACVLFAGTAMAAAPSGVSGKASPAVPVNAVNYVRATTAIQFGKYYARAGGINRFSHQRELVSVDNRSSKRLNRDTLYSIAVVDISKGAVLNMPDAHDRYMSVQVVNEDGYTNAVFHEGGQYELSVEQFDTPFVWLLGRTLVLKTDEQDMSVVHALQDRMNITSASAQPYSHPAYDPESFESTTYHRVELAKGLADNARAAGSKEEVNPIKQLLLAAYGFGTLPETESFLVVEEPDLPSDGAYTLEVKDVPVDGFWSLTVYDKDGYFQRNEYNAYGFSDQTAEKNPDGSVTLHFGGNPDSVNYLPITEGWNYVVRLYRPREEILSGAWTFPKVRSAAE
jgi:hypothetical protein